ncbi:Uncharacterised protein [Acinetobacter baumannii]|nr:Uncharacterised protein [Acinetobacter baumannii]
MQLPLQLMQFSYLLNHDHIICHREFLVQMGLNSKRLNVLLVLRRYDQQNKIQGLRFHVEPINYRHLQSA